MIAEYPDADHPLQTPHKGGDFHPATWIFWVIEIERQEEAKIMYPLITQELAEVRHSDQLKAAEHRRLISCLRAGQPSMIDRLLEKTGDLLAMTGGQLQERRVSQRTGRLASAEKKSAVP